MHSYGVHVGTRTTYNGILHSTMYTTLVHPLQGGYTRYGHVVVWVVASGVVCTHYSIGHHLMHQ